MLGFRGHFRILKSGHFNFLLIQLPVDQWYVKVALLDRLIHNAHRLALKVESMRKKMVKLTEREHLN